MQIRKDPKSTNLDQENSKITLPTTKSGPRKIQNSFALPMAYLSQYGIRYQTLIKSKKKSK